MGKTFTVTVKGQDQEFESKFDVLDEAIEALIAKFMSVPIHEVSDGNFK